VDAADAADQRRLAGPVVADQRGDLAVADEIYAPRRVQRLVEEAAG